FLHPLGLGLEILGLAGPLVTPELAGFPQEAFQFQPKATRAPRLVLQHLVDVFLEVVQVFLLLDAQQLIVIVTLAAVGYYDSRIVGGNEFPYLFLAMRE